MQPPVPYPYASWGIAFTSSHLIPHKEVNGYFRELSGVTEIFVGYKNLVGSPNQDQKGQMMLSSDSAINPCERVEQELEALTAALVSFRRSQVHQSVTRACQWMSDVWQLQRGTSSKCPASKLSHSNTTSHMRLIEASSRNCETNNSRWKSRIRCIQHNCYLSIFLGDEVRLWFKPMGLRCLRPQHRAPVSW